MKSINIYTVERVEAGVTAHSCESIVVRQHLHMNMPTARFYLHANFTRARLAEVDRECRSFRVPNGRVLWFLDAIEGSE